MVKVLSVTLSFYKEEIMFQLGYDLLSIAKTG